MNSLSRNDRYGFQAVLLLFLCAGPLGLAPDTSAADSKRVPVTKIEFEDNDNHKIFPSPEAACSDYVQQVTQGATFTGLDDYHPGDDRARCLWKTPEGVTDGFTGVTVREVCPIHSNSFGTDPLKTRECECDSGFIAKGGNCVEAEQIQEGSQATAERNSTEDGVTRGNDQTQPDAGAETHQATATQGGGGANGTSHGDGDNANPNDPCLDKPTRAEDPEPNKTRCPLSWRAWDLKREIHVKFGMSIVSLERQTIAVSDGFIQDKKIRLITTNDTSLWSKLREWAKSKAITLLADEQISWVGPQEGEHAEDSAKRNFEMKGVDKLKTIRMGSDPKACPTCSATYANIPWISHERLRK